MTFKQSRKKEGEGGGADDGAWAINQTQTQRGVNGKHWYWPALKKGRAKENIFSSLVVNWNEIFSTRWLTHPKPLYRIPLSYQKTKWKNQNICSFKKCHSPSSAQNVLSAFWLQLKWRIIKIKIIKRCGVSSSTSSLWNAAI